MRQESISEDKDQLKHKINERRQIYSNLVTKLYKPKIDPLKAREIDQMHDYIPRHNKSFDTFDKFLTIKHSVLKPSKPWKSHFISKIKQELPYFSNKRPKFMDYLTP